MVGARDADNPPVTFIQLRAAWEKRRRVSIRPEPKEDEVETRYPRPERRFDLTFVGRCVAGRARHRMHDRRDFREERLPCHPVVRGNIIHCDAALIPEEDLGLRPRIVECGEVGVHLPWRLPTGQGDRARGHRAEKLGPGRAEIWRDDKLDHRHVVFLAGVRIG